MTDQNPYVIGADFLTSAAKLEQAPDHSLPEIAVTGRSNVGKSSLINALCNRRNLAKTSKKPGKTRLINFFEIRVRNPEFRFCLVDLPGYGFAKVAKQERQRWGETLEPFLRKRPNLVAVIQLIDSRHPPTKLDVQMREWLTHTGHPVITILTKADKISRTAGEKARRTVAASLLSAGDPAPILFSTIKRFGSPESLAILARLIRDQATINLPT